MFEIELKNGKKIRGRTVGELVKLLEAEQGRIDQQLQKLKQKIELLRLTKIEISKLLGKSKTTKKTAEQPQEKAE